MTLLNNLTNVFNFHFFPFCYLSSMNMKLMYSQRTTIKIYWYQTSNYIYFKGPEANKLEQDFSRLLSTGKLESPSLYIPGYLFPANRKTRLSYKLCGSDNEKGIYDLQIYLLFFENKTGSSIYIQTLNILIFCWPSFGVKSKTPAKNSKPFLRMFTLPGK